MITYQGRRTASAECHLIISGEVSVKISANGENIKVAKLESGDVVGEMSIIDPKKASATARIVSEEANYGKLQGLNLIIL